MTTFSINLEINSSTMEEVQGVPVREITLTAFGGQNVDNAVFLMKKIGTAPAEMVTVCGASDMTNYGTVAPGVNDNFQHFRVNTITYRDDRPLKVSEFITNVKRRIQALLDSLKELEENGINQTFHFEA